jgi:hypothetical protein
VVPFWRFLKAGKVERPAHERNGVYEKGLPKREFGNEGTQTWCDGRLLDPGRAAPAGRTGRTAVKPDRTLREHRAISTKTLWTGNA